MNSEELHKFADFLAAISEATTKHGAQLGAYGPVDVRLPDDTVMRIQWDAEHEEYLASPETP